MAAPSQCVRGRRSLPNAQRSGANRRVSRACSSRSSRHRSLAAARAAEDAAPTVTVEFNQQEGSPAVSVACPSGEELLRNVMLDNKVDVYTAWGKLWSCGGAGQCGTCIVQVDGGAELLSERNATEEKKLSKKPQTWRLACQTVVGDGTNSGRVAVTTKPQR